MGTRNVCARQVPLKKTSPLMSFPASSVFPREERRSPPLQVHVRKTEKLFPIESRDCVPSGSIVIPDGVHDGLIERRHLVRTEA